MALTLQRTIYTNSDVSVDPIGSGNALNTWQNHLGGAKKTYVSTVQNSTFTLNIPRADVNVFGLQGTLDRPQLEAETATLEFGFIPELCGSAAIEGVPPAGLDHLDLNLLIADTIHNTPDYVNVTSANVGAITKSLMNSLSGEASVGALPTFTASFTGATLSATDPAHVTAAKYPDMEHGIANAPVKVVDIAVAKRATIVTPKDINLYHNAATALLDEAVVPGDLDGDNDGVIESCAQSGSFSWDVPVETILCLGANPASDGIALGNPPGTSSFTVEALSAQLELKTTSQDYAMLFGHYLFNLVGGNIDSRTHNLAVGDLYGTYNYVIGGTGDGFTVDDCTP